jgi:hypothetical protein
VIRTALAVLALVFALAHLPYLPSTLEDIDSVNFALGIRDFDVANHRPHPPGYPIYIALGKLGVALAKPFSGASTPSSIEARVLAMLSLIAAMFAIVFLYRVLASFAIASASGPTTTPPWRAVDPRALAATALAVACPLFWYAAVRPMSDVPGLAAALSAQACLALAWWRQQGDTGTDGRLSPELTAASGRMIVLGALLAAIAIGFRSQNAVLTLPLLGAVLVDRIGRGVAGALIGSSVAFAVGIAAWAIPLFVASGGVNAYLSALGGQAGEDFAGVEMLYVNPNARLAAFALLRTFIYPWDSLVLGGIVVALAAIGSITLLLRERRTLWAVAMVSVPYLIFHLLFQDTTFTRYALPLVPPVAFLAVCAFELAGPRAVVLATGALAVWGVAVATPTLAIYGSEPSPTSRAVAAINHAAIDTRPGALAFHQTFRRPLEAESLNVNPVLPSPPRREWLELVKYWRDGHTEPLWFLADPRRSDLALIDPRSRTDRLELAWSFRALSDLGGMRPFAATWYRIPPPGWFAEDGWALTPETAGIARLVGQGPHLGPISAWVRRRPDPMRLLIGGRHLGTGADPPIRFVVAIDGRTVAQWELGPGFFVHEFELPAGALDGATALARLTVESHPVAAQFNTLSSSQPARIASAIEQFDLQPRGTLMWAYDQGWHEAEYDPQVGVWRWTSDRATLRVIDASTPITVSLRVGSVRRDFDDPATVRMLAGDRVIAETVIAEDTHWTVQVPLETLQSVNGRITIDTDRTFVPSERDGRPDQRRLGLRILGVDIAAQP